MEERGHYFEQIFTTLRTAWAKAMGFVEMFEGGMNRDMSYLARLACENALYTINKVGEAMEENIGVVEVTWVADKYGFFNPGKVVEVTFTPTGSPQKIEDNMKVRHDDFLNTLEETLCGPKGFVEVLEEAYGDESEITKLGRFVCEDVSRVTYMIMEIVREFVGHIEFEWTDNEYVFHNSGEIKGVFFKPVAGETNSKVILQTHLPDGLNAHGRMN